MPQPVNTYPYPFIQAWGQHLGSLPDYVQGEVRRAQAANAPWNTIDQNSDGTWCTVEDIQFPEKRAMIHDMARKFL